MSESSINMGRLDIESVYFAKILTKFWLYSYPLEILTAQELSAQADKQALFHIISS